MTCLDSRCICFLFLSKGRTPTVQPQLAVRGNINSSTPHSIEYSIRLGWSIDILYLHGPWPTEGTREREGPVIVELTRVEFDGDLEGGRFSWRAVLRPGVACRRNCSFLQCTQAQVAAVRGHDYLITLCLRIAQALPSSSRAAISATLRSSRIAALSCLTMTLKTALAN